MGAKLNLSPEERRARKREQTAAFLARNPGYLKEWFRKNGNSPKRVAWREQYKAKRGQMATDLPRIYGIDLDDYDAMLAKQDGKCAICQKPPLGTSRATKRLHIDHCHETGAVRGLLCQSCNVHLGWYEKKTSEVKKYLERGTE